MTNISIVVQARRGSIRLPDKVLLPFARNHSLLEFQLRRLQDAALAPIILATTNHPQDNLLEDIAHSLAIPVVRGSADDVLSRYVDAASRYDVECVIRICADNPFLNMDWLSELISYCHAHARTFDYASHFLPNGNPGVLSHWGMFAEAVTRTALDRILALNPERIYREHVTNYIYTHPSHFTIRRLALPQAHMDDETLNCLRLTIDTLTDLNTLRAIQRALDERHQSGTLPEILKILHEHPRMLASMRQQIFNNSK